MPDEKGSEEITLNISDRMSVKNEKTGEMFQVVKLHQTDGTDRVVISWTTVKNTPEGKKTIEHSEELPPDHPFSKAIKWSDKSISFDQPK